MLITQALDLAQHTASAYHQAPDHIRRMLNQLFFDHVYLVPDQDTDQLTTTATCLPPFDSILRWRATADVESTEGAVVERRKSEGVEGTEGVRGSALDEPANLGKSQGETEVTDDEGSAEGMGRARPGPTPTADEVERDDEVGTTDLIAPQAAHITARSARLDGSELAETSQNTPVSIQKPTSWDDHDVSLSAMQLVALSLPHSKQWEACWRYVMGVVDLAVVPTGHGSSLAEDPGSSLDVAGRADTEQGNRASAPANTADVASREKPGQEDDADSPAARTVAEKHEQDEDLGALPSSATMAGAETSGQNGELGTPAEATTATQQAAGSTTPTSHQPADGSAVRTPAPVTTSSTIPPRRINRYLRPQLVEEMVALHQAGQTVAQIATRFGFHRTTVARHLKQAGETLRTDPADPAFQERVRQAYAELGTVKHTAQKLGVSKDAVRKVVRGE